MVVTYVENEMLIYRYFGLFVSGLRLLHSPWIYDAISWTKFTSKTPVGRVSLDPVILHNNNTNHPKVDRIQLEPRSSSTLVLLTKILSI